VRRPTSLYAGLAAGCKVVRAYDIGKYPEVDEVEQLCEAEGIDFKYINESTLETTIEPCDILGIDTYHSYTQLKRELERHKDKVRKYIWLHDTTTFENVAEPPYECIPSDVACGREQALFYSTAALHSSQWPIGGLRAVDTAEPNP